MPVTKTAVFRSKKIRKIIHNNEWWFSVVDVCEALTDSVDAGAYWRKLKQRLQEEGSEVVTFCHGLKLPQRKSPRWNIPVASKETAKSHGEAAMSLELRGKNWNRRPVKKW